MIVPIKTRELPEAGVHTGVLADIVDLGVITSTFEGVTKSYPAVQFIWVLTTVGKDGKPIQIWSRKLNVSNWHEKANVYKVTKQILGGPPPANFDLELMIGSTRQIIISRDKSPDGTKDFANIMGIIPAPVGVTLQVPTDFVRDKYKPKTQAGPNGQPVQTFQQPPQQANPGIHYGPGQTTAPVNQGSDVKF